MTAKTPAPRKRGQPAPAVEATSDSSDDEEEGPPHIFDGSDAANTSDDSDDDAPAAAPPRGRGRGGPRGRPPGRSGKGRAGRTQSAPAAARPKGKQWQDWKKEVVPITVKAFNRTPGPTMSRDQLELLYGGELQPHHVWLHMFNDGVDEKLLDDIEESLEK